MEPSTLNELFFGAMDRAAARPAVMRRKHAGHWEDISGATLLDRVHDLSLGLRELGVRPETGWRFSPRTGPNGP